VNAVDGQGGKTAWELADEVKDAGKKEAVLAVLSEYSLHAAAKAGKAERVSALIAAGQDVNAQGGQYFDGMTAAQLAVLGGHDEALKVLLAAGVDVKARNTVSMVKSAMIVTRDEGVGEVGGRKWGRGRRRGGPLALLLLLLVAGAHVCVCVCVCMCVSVCVRACCIQSTVEGSF
jgi:hypothetical protein